MLLKKMAGLSLSMKLESLTMIENFQLYLMDIHFLATIMMVFKTTSIAPFTNAWFSQKFFCLIFSIHDFIGKMSKKRLPLVKNINICSSNPTHFTVHHLTIQPLDIKTTHLVLKVSLIVELLATNPFLYPELITIILKTQLIILISLLLTKNDLTCT